MTNKEQEYINRLTDAFNEYLDFEKEVEHLILDAADCRKIGDGFTTRIWARLEYLEKRIPYKFLDVFCESQTFGDPEREKIIKSEDAIGTVNFLERDFLDRVDKLHTYFYSLRILLSGYSRTT